MKKLTDEELSRVLTAHHNGQLTGPTIKFEEVGCLVQVAKNTDNIYTGYSKNDCAAAEWFDDKYKPKWSVEKFLDKLIEQGLA